MRALKSINTNIAVLRGSTPVKSLGMVLPNPRTPEITALLCNELLCWKLTFIAQ